MPDAAAPCGPELSALAAAHGVAVEYDDMRSGTTPVSADTVRAVLAALDVPAATDAEVDASLTAATEAPWRRLLPPSVVVREGSARWFPVHVPHGESVTTRVVLESGDARDCAQIDTWVEPRLVDGELTGRATFEVPGDLPCGWHELEATVEGGEPKRAPLIVTPQRIEIPAALRDERAVGVAAQLYQVHGADSWGLGDIGDLSRLCSWSAGHGADFVLVNPLHAAEPGVPRQRSPYLPTSRLFLDPLYLRPEHELAYAALTGENRAAVDELAAKAQTLLGAELIDRDAAWTAKRMALRVLFDSAGDSSRDSAGDLEAFRADGGTALERFATWCAIADVHGAQWRSWPDGLQNPESQDVADFVAEHSAEVDFHVWLQARCRSQLDAAQEAARSEGMRIGIMTDLAVGVHPEGADTWALPDSLARGVSVGAPPDYFNQRGQDWSQPPPRPDVLAETGYAMLRDLLRSSMIPGGGIRIDHILGLFRLWWIPAGRSPAEGTYVMYDHEAMLGVLALEAMRAGVVVVGEDLGTVPDHVQGALAERGVLGTSILWFEQDDDGPIAPESYRTDCLASVTTHDLPPTAGYLDLVHVDVRERLGLLDDPEEARKEAAEELEAFRAARDAAGFAPRPAQPGSGSGTGSGAGSAESDDEVVALHGWLGRSPSRLLGVALADLVGERWPINQPGTSDEYPNWMLPLTDSAGRRVSLEQIEELGPSSLPGRIFDALGTNRTK